MTGGLLDGLRDPVLMAEVAERRRLVLTLADRWNCCEDAARAWLVSEDHAAMELFAIGNTIPREILH
jgi:hypothetical protein